MTISRAPGVASKKHCHLVFLDEANHLLDLYGRMEPVGERIFPCDVATKQIWTDFFRRISHRSIEQFIGRWMKIIHLNDNGFSTLLSGIQPVATENAVFPTPPLPVTSNRLLSKSTI